MQSENWEKNNPIYLSREKDEESGGDTGYSGSNDGFSETNGMEDHVNHGQSEDSEDSGDNSADGDYHENGNSDSEKPSSDKATNHSSKESEHKPGPFRIDIQDRDLMFEFVQKGVNSSIIGGQIFDGPLKMVEVKLSPNQRTFNLTAEITYSIKEDEEKNYNYSENVNKPLINRYILDNPDNKVEQRDNVAYITSKDGIRLILYPSRYHDDKYMLSTGNIRVNLMDMQVISAPRSDKENFNKTINSFSDTLERVIDAYYKDANMKPPEDVLTLSFLSDSPLPNKNAGVFPDFGGLFGGKDNEQEQRRSNVKGLEVENPNISFDEVGGQIDAKNEIKGLAFALKNPESYAKWGTKPPKGILLYGPPGTGKTLMARALASEADARFLHVSASDIASKYYGESEKILSEIFKEAKESPKKTILFFDEIDAIAPTRSDSSHEATRKTVSTFLENMDGMGSSDNVMVVASTNWLAGIDPALLRAGRFNRWVEVALPDYEAKKQILSIHINKANKSAGRDDLFAIDYDAVMHDDPELSGADIAEIVRRALENKARLDSIGENPGPVTTEDLKFEMNNYEKTKRAKKSIGFTAP